MKIIKQLRIKVILSIEIIQALILSVILFGLNISLRHKEYSTTNSFLEQMSYNNGHGHRKPKPAPSAPTFNQSQDEFFHDYIITSKDPENESGFKPVFGIGNISDSFSQLRNYFAVNVSHEGAINEIIQDFPLSFTASEISTIVLDILAQKKTSSIANGFQYLITPTLYGNQLICIMNKNSEMATLQRFSYYSMLVFAGGMIIALILGILLSKYSVNQTARAFEKQKQFIADAGHELKTPIAVIGANIDVLETDGDFSNNKFFQYIKSENKRMSELVKDLLYLARDDADRLELIRSDFDFSNAVDNAILPFEVVAFESGMSFQMNIEKDIICNGEEKSLKQVFVILVDNAIKNSDKGAEITVNAYTENQKIIYKVRNTGAGIPKEELEKIFLRFYRSDASRARKTGGYGLGLAIAQTIATQHGGFLTAASEAGKWAEFTLTLPKKPKHL